MANKRVGVQVVDSTNPEFYRKFGVVTVEIPKGTPRDTEVPVLLDGFKTTVNFQLSQLRFPKHNPASSGKKKHKRAVIGDIEVPNYPGSRDPGKRNRR